MAMTDSAPAIGPATRRGSRLSALSALFWRRPAVLGWTMAMPPALWLLVFYLGALAALFLASLWRVDSMSGAIVHEWTTQNFALLWEEPVYRKIALRTILMALAVTVTDCVLALPLAYFMTWIAPRAWRSALMALVLVPLWSSLLARVYAWRVILAHEGIANWTLQLVGLPSGAIGYSQTAVWLVFSYLWLPFVVLPTATAFERVPQNVLEASADLGGRGWRTFRKVILPLALPGLAAGSISAFSLTLGDFVTPMLVGAAGSDFIGNVVYSSVGVANNLPFAAAFAVVPLVVAGSYLVAMHRLRAFEAL